MKWIGISRFITEEQLAESSEKRQLSSRAMALRGFSLTELAVVLGVGAIILGGIWMAASQSWENARQQALKTDIYSTVKNIRALYAGQPSITGAIIGLTPQLVVQNIIPGDMARTGNGCTNASSSGQIECADHPWGVLTGAAVQNGSFGICAWDPSTKKCAAGASQFFAIGLDGLSFASCVNGAPLNSGADSPPAFYDVMINGASMLALGHGFPVVASDAQANCTASSTVYFIYRLVAPQS